MGEAISLRVLNLRANARKVVKQIETPRSPDPIMRRPCADREEKRVTRGSDIIRTRRQQEQLDLNDPNQRGLLASTALSAMSNGIRNFRSFYISLDSAYPNSRLRSTSPACPPTRKPTLATGWRGPAVTP